MDLRQHLVDLVAPLLPGEELVAGARFVRASTEVGLWLVFDVRGSEIIVEIAPIGDGPFAARSARFGLSYRCEGGRNAVAPQVGMALARAVAQRVARNEERVGASDALQRPSPNAPRIREVHADHMLEEGIHASDHFYRISPYVGCLIGCRFCYAQTPLRRQRRLELLPEVPWGSYVDVRVNAPELLSAELATKPPRPIKFCPIVSDPYQAVEASYAITRRCLEAIGRAKSPWPTLVLTRSALVSRDADVLAGLPSSWVGASLPTIDDGVRKRFEPRAAPIGERLAILKSLRDRGIRTFAVVQPMLPGSVDALADALAECVTSVSIDVLRGEEDAKADFDDPRYVAARDGAWQSERAGELRAALHRRGVAVWSGELPPELSMPAPS